MSHTPPPVSQACAQLDRMEEALRSAPAPDLPRVHAETADALQGVAEPAIRVGNQLLDQAGRGADGTEVRGGGCGRGVGAEVVRRGGLEIGE